jgi:hypothetical protein
MQILNRPLVLRPSLGLSLSCLTLFFGALVSVRATTTAELPRQTVLEAVQRGTLGRLPAHVVVKNVQFAETSRIDTEITIKGEASLAVLEDSYVGVRSVGLNRPSGNLRATVVRLANRSGSFMAAPFQAVVSLLDPVPRIVPQLPSADTVGQPLGNFKSNVIEGSPQHRQLKELDQTFASAEEKFQRVKTKWETLEQIRELVTSYDAYIHIHSARIEGMLTKGLDSKTLGKTYRDKIYPEKKFANRREQHAAFVALVDPVLRPEHARIKALFDAREAAGRAYVEFLEKI